MNIIQELYENKSRIIEEIINDIFYVMTSLNYKFIM